MTREEFETKLRMLFSPDGSETARTLLAQGGGVSEFMALAAAGVNRAYNIERLFGRGQRLWQVRVEGDAVHFDRLEYHERQGTWDTMVESFCVPMPRDLEVTA